MFIPTGSDTKVQQRSCENSGSCPEVPRRKGKRDAGEDREAESREKEERGKRYDSYFRFYKTLLFLFYKPCANCFIITHFFI